MSEELEKYSGKELSIIKSEIEKRCSEGLEVGDIFIKPDSSSIAVKVTKIYYEEKDYQNPAPSLRIMIGFQETENWELTKWEEERVYNLNDFHQYFVSGSVRIKRGENVSEYLDRAKKIMDGELDIESLNDVDTDKNVETDTAIISKNSKNSLILLQNNLEEKKRNAEVIKAFVSIEMEKKKRELDAIRKKMNGVIDVFKKKIGKIMRVITTIELYLGIDEELFQIQEGELAPKETPISFRQAVLYMDEEIGHWKDGGLDFTNIDWFDRWLVENENYKKILPEEKGLVVFRPRRYDKDYGTGDPRYETSMNHENKYNTYLLIRNGECLYRVYTENIVILPRLFPKRDELMKLMEDIKKENISSWDEEKKKDNIDDLLHQYKKRAILMQGLIDRTEVFHPLPVEKINLFDMGNLDGKVNFIYDDEATLPSGRLSFWDWHKQINSKIGKGSRVLVTGTGFSRRDRSISDRLYHYYSSEFSIPDPPNVGIYEVEEYLVQETIKMYQADFDEWKKDKNESDYEITYVQENGHILNWPRENRAVPDTYEDILSVRSTFKHLTILYNPGDTVYGPWGTYDPHDRKKRIRMRIYPDDHFILNYDQISLDDIEFYMTSRVDRPNYLSMLPLLSDMKKWRIDEIENEKNFAKMVYAQVFQKLHKESEESIYTKIWESIDWWKFKNMWKRPIDKDDAKALRMIIKRIFKEI